MKTATDFRVVLLEQLPTGQRRFDTQKRIIFDCLLLRTPSMSIDGGRVFTPDALRDVARLVKTTTPKVKVLHDTQASASSALIGRLFPNGELTPGRVIGAVTNGRVDELQTEVRGDFGWLGWADDALEAILTDPAPENAWAFSMHGTGLSESDGNGSEVVVSVKEIKSIDLVPAAASGAKNLWESAAGGKRKPPPMSDKEYAAAVRDALDLPPEETQEKLTPEEQSYVDAASDSELGFGD